MNEKYLLFIHLIFAEDSNYIAIVQVFCCSLKKRMKGHLPCDQKESGTNKRLFFIESRPEMRGIARMGQVDIKSNTKDDKQLFLSNTKRQWLNFRSFNLTLIVYS